MLTTLAATQPSAAALFAHYKSGYVIAAYILICAVLSLIATAMLADYTNKDISEEYDKVQTGQPARGTAD